MNDIKLGRYRHFKGNEYEVIGIAKHSETEEPMVVYRALYEDGGLWVRPASMWNETVERDGKSFQRFTLLEEKTDDVFDIALFYCKDVLTKAQLIQLNEKPIWVLPLEESNNTSIISHPMYAILKLNVGCGEDIVGLTTTQGTVTWRLSEYGSKWLVMATEPAG